MQGNQKIIIDGYNIIHADKTLSQLIRKDIEKARGLFVERLKIYLSRKKINATVVFDGKGGLLEAEPVIPGKLQVIFSPENKSADEIIIETLKNSPNPREYIVVTSDDTDIGKRARQMGTRAVSSEDFLLRMEGREHESKPASEKPVAGEDVEFWLDKFSEDQPH